MKFISLTFVFDHADPRSAVSRLVPTMGPATTPRVMTRADGASASGTYFECNGLGTSNEAYLDIEKSSVVVTIEDAGVNTGKLTSSNSTSKTYGGWSSKVYFGTGDTMLSDPEFAGLLGQRQGDVERRQREPAMDRHVYEEGAERRRVPAARRRHLSGRFEREGQVHDGQQGSLRSTSPDSKVGDFVYNVTMKVSGILCTEGTVTPTSCSAAVADKIASQAFKDGSSSGQPYVSTRTKDQHRLQLGRRRSRRGVRRVRFYTVTTSSDADGCAVSKITTAD